MKRIVLLFVIGLIIYSCNETKRWVDLNDNGKKEIYEDAEKPVDERVDDLIARMTLEEKIIALMDGNKIAYEIYEHEPVYTNPAMAEATKPSATESKPSPSPVKLQQIETKKNEEVSAKKPPAPVAPLRGAAPKQTAAESTPIQREAKPDIGKNPPGAPAGTAGSEKAE